MIKPEMIIFDYGHTILHEPDHSAENGNRAIYKYIKDNPDNITFETFNKTCLEMFAEIKANRGTLEIHEHHFLKLLYDYLNITLSVPIAEAERIIWNGISEGAVMPFAAEMLDYLNNNGIRTAVISNINWSEAALCERINRLLPNNKFEFVLASSEYLFKKPHPFMFEIALKKAKLSADKVWFCGDSVYCDIDGAHSVGMFPVLYEGSTKEEKPSVRDNEGVEINFEHLHIKHWSEMIEVLQQIK